tara:strand:+ start:331 stop:1014 length:684 start_codon:yes stop_codon:yes gene_type:complete
MTTQKEKSNKKTMFRFFFLVLFISNALAFNFNAFNFKNFKKLSMSREHSSDLPSSEAERIKSQLSLEKFSNIGKFGIMSVGMSTLLSHSKSVLADSDDELTKTPDYSQFITTDSGLKYYDVKLGDGSGCVPGDLVRVHYTGWLDGFDGIKKFDSSYDRRSPLKFTAGVRQVIAGWDESLITNLKVGGVRKVIIPPNLGYGARGAGGVIPPNATLYFVMELVSVNSKK